MNSKKTYSFIGATLGAGAADSRCENGPRVFREAGYLEVLRDLEVQIEDLGDIKTTIAIDEAAPKNINNYNQVLGSLKVLKQKCAHAWSSNTTPFVLGGDHSLSIATVSAASEHLKSLNQSNSLGVIWVDAHADLNRKESSPSGNVHGMSLGILLGENASAQPSCFEAVTGTCPVLNPSQIVFIGTRELDPPEQALIDTLGIKNITMKQVHDIGINRACELATEHLTKHCSHYMVSFDIDSLDPRYVPGTGTPVADGLSRMEAISCLSKLQQNPAYLITEVVEYNPLKDLNKITGDLILDLTKIIVVD